MSDLERDAIFIKHIVDKKYRITKSGDFINISTGNHHDRNNQKFTFSYNKEVYGINKARAIWIAHNGPIEQGLVVYVVNSTIPLCLDNVSIATEDEFNKIMGDRKRKPKKERRKKEKKEKIKKDRVSHLRKLCNEEVLALRREYKETPFSIRNRAKTLNMSHLALRDLLKGITYKEVPEPVESITKKFAGTRKATTRFNPDKPKIDRPKRIRVRPKLPKPPKPVFVPKPPKPVFVKEPKPVVVFSDKDKESRLALIKRMAEKRKEKG